MSKLLYPLIGLTVSIVLSATLSTSADAYKAEYKLPFDTKYEPHWMPSAPQYKFTTKASEPPAQEKEEAVEPIPEPDTVYVVEQGDTLSKIAETFDTEWQRIWAKNESLSHQDVLNVGDHLVIPKPAEELQERDVVSTPTQAPIAPQRASHGLTGHIVSTANTYTYGQCTWYVKNRRPDIGGFWGNANQWIGSAQASGYSTGSVPVVGAIGVDYSGYYGHVVYVESVNGDSVTVSEMNYAGVGVVNTRTVPAGTFTYIY